jgi:hypothetical protein
MGVSSRDSRAFKIVLRQHTVVVRVELVEAAMQRGRDF